VDVVSRLSKALPEGRPTLQSIDPLSRIRKKPGNFGKASRRRNEENPGCRLLNHGTTGMMLF